MMFESNVNGSFQRSEIYFTVIELLRIASEWIKSNTQELELCSWQEIEDPEGGVYDAVDSAKESHLKRKTECKYIINNNWKIILKKDRLYSQVLLDRIHKKMEETKSLRDGVCLLHITKSC